MHKLLLPLLLINYSVFSQISLTNVDFATGSDTVRMSQAQDDGFDFLSTGAGYVWDFSNLIPVSQQLKNFRPLDGEPTFIQVIYGTFAPLKYQASYFIESTDVPIDQLSSFLPVPIEDIFQFTRVSQDSVTSVGYSMSIDGNNVPFKSDTIEKRYNLPVEYGNTHFSRGYTFVDFNPIMDAIWIQHRTRATEVDGHGIITTPYGTFNALRIKHDITEVDSLYMVLPVIGGTWIPIPVPNSHEYEWWANNEMEPILKITTNDILGTETITAIEYRDIYRGLDAGLEELAMQFEICPNPAVNQLTITTTQRMSSAKIVDAAGKIVKTIEFDPVNSKTIEVAELPNGIYQIFIQSDSLIGFKSFVKQ